MIARSPGGGLREVTGAEVEDAARAALVSSVCSARWCPTCRDSVTLACLYEGHAIIAFHRGATPANVVGVCAVRAPTTDASGCQYRTCIIHRGAM